MKKRKFLFIFLPGIILGLFLSFTINKTVHFTSTDKYCASCHTHPQATESWKQSVHYNNTSGIKVHCVQCHLPPKGQGLFMAKVKTGVRDLWGKLFKDSADYKWDEKSKRENAIHFVYETSCKKCHQILIPEKKTTKREKAHNYYIEQKVSGDIHCINCHLAVGHKNS